MYFIRIVRKLKAVKFLFQNVVANHATLLELFTHHLITGTIISSKTYTTMLKSVAVIIHIMIVVVGITKKTSSPAKM